MLTLERKDNPPLQFCLHSSTNANLPLPVKPSVNTADVRAARPYHNCSLLAGRYPTRGKRFTLLTAKLRPPNDALASLPPAQYRKPIMNILSHYFNFLKSLSNAPPPTSAPKPHNQRQAFHRLFPTSRYIAALGCALLIHSPSPCAAQDQTTPSKTGLIELLKTTYALLEKGDYPSASKYFVLPPKFTPNMLEAFIKRREISLDGIIRLEKEAKFGKASAVFGDKKAAALAKRAGVDVTQCYGFYHQSKEATAEVIALWKDGGFKIVRLDDVGKLQPTGTTATPTKPK